MRKIKNAGGSPYKTGGKKARLKRVMRFIRFLLVTALFATTIGYAVLSPYFNIKKIIARESPHYSDKTLIEASGIRSGLNGFRLVFEGMGKVYFLRIGIAERAIIETCPYVKTAKVKFIIPSTVSIEVEERIASAVLSVNGTNMLIDKEGYLLELNADTEKANLPVIRGINPDSFVLGEKIEISEKILLSAFKVFDTIREVDDMNQEKLLTYVDYVDVGNVDNVGFSLQSRVMVNLGTTEDLHYKINAARTIFTTNIKKTERGRLDFSTGANPVFTPEENGG